ncbi:glycosyltransferase family 2 protein [Desertihabitans brevis]|uniref:Glycosyltransferase family 2 protein n=2 Tax=Desertihabitans brevis TaxID=2268447 RepID=A0A367YZH2_9ACTN|nr:glycosyltransferase family 2 protein [Desertihabitans brevis]
MPVREEERHLARAVSRILSQDYPGELEVVMAVAPSADRTEQIAADLAAADPRVRVVPNPAGRTPHALNAAIAASRFDVVVRVDGHGELTPGYLRTAVELLRRTGAANVGGIMDAQGETAFEQAVAVAYTSRLGLGGSAFHLTTSREQEAETVFLGSFRKDALLEVGGYDETLHRAQDWELNYRLRQAGHRIWFSPTMRVTYRPRSTLRALARQFFETGRWRREVVRRHPDTASPRYLAPPVAVTGVVGGLLLALAGGTVGPRWLRLAALAPLGYLAVVVGGAAALRRDLPPGVRARLPLVFAVMHLCWGTGFLVGRPQSGEEHDPTRAP